MAQQKKSVKLEQDYFLRPKEQRKLESEGWALLSRGRSEAVFVRDVPDEPPVVKKPATKKTAKKATKKTAKKATKKTW